MSLGYTNTAGDKNSNYAWQKSMALAQGQILSLLTTIASGLASGSWVKEIPSGAINGVNTVFTLQNIPIVGSDMVFLSGQLQAGGGIDYTLSGNTITFNIPPNIGEQLFVFYQKP